MQSRVSRHAERRKHGSRPSDGERRRYGPRRSNGSKRRNGCEQRDTGRRHTFGLGKLARVDFQTLDEIFAGGGYGITVDTKGRVWTTSSMSRFDYVTKLKVPSNVFTGGGIAQDLQGRMWSGGGSGVVSVDMETLLAGPTVVLPGGMAKGVSVDIDGFIWAIPEGDTQAYKIDPNTYAIQSYDGLNYPYTYSDMTGGQIANVICNPPEG